MGYLDQTLMLTLSKDLDQSGDNSALQSDRDEGSGKGLARKTTSDSL